MVKNSSDKLPPGKMPNGNKKDTGTSADKNSDLLAKSKNDAGNNNTSNSNRSNSSNSYSEKDIVTPTKLRTTVV